MTHCRALVNYASSIIGLPGREPDDMPRERLEMVVPVQFFMT